MLLKLQIPAVEEVPGLKRKPASAPASVAQGASVSVSGPGASGQSCTISTYAKPNALACHWQWSLFLDLGPAAHQSANTYSADTGSASRPLLRPACLTWRLPGWPLASVAVRPSLCLAWRRIIIPCCLAGLCVPEPPLARQAVLGSASLPQNHLQTESFQYCVQKCAIYS